MNKKIALLIGSLKDRAGSERVVVDSANYLSQFYDVYIFVCGDTRSKYIVDDSVDVISLTESIPNTKIGQLFWYVKYIRALRKKCKELDIELIISHWTKLSICLCFLNKNLITWAHEHQNDKLLPSWLIYLKRYVYPKLDYLTVLNKSEASISNELYNSNIGIIPGYVSKEFSHILCGEKKNQLLFIGRLVDEKQPLLLLDMLKKSNFMENDWTLIMIGDGYYKQKIRDEINSNFGNKVFLLEPTDLLNYYSESKALLIASKTEGFGLTIIEAMSQKCIPISFDCDFGPRNIINNNIDGFLCEDERAYLNKINCFFGLSNKEIKKLSDNAYTKSKEYSQDAVLLIWREKVNGLLK